jgi:hypothetical protein
MISGRSDQFRELFELLFQSDQCDNDGQNSQNFICTAEPFELQFQSDHSDNDAQDSQNVVCTAKPIGLSFQSDQSDNDGQNSQNVVCTARKGGGWVTGLSGFNKAVEEEFG